MCCVKICLTKLLIRRGPDRHQAGDEILLLEWDLKTFSNHCQLLAVSLTNAADFFLEWDQRGQCFGEQEETEAMPPRERHASLRLMTYFVKADRKNLC